MAVTMVIVQNSASGIGVHLFRNISARFSKVRSCSTEVWDSLSYKRRKSALFPKAMRCRLCSYNQPHKHGYYQQGEPALLLFCLQAFLYIPLTRFTIDDSSSRKRFTRFSNRTLDGSSRGWLGAVGELMAPLSIKSCAGQKRR